ncbi:gamma-glutamyltransferase [Shigella flexneri]
MLLCSQEVVLAPPPRLLAARLVWCGGRCLPPGTRETGNGSVCGRHCHSVGVDILQGGRECHDAAVAVGYALAVTHPQGGNLGGGGFMLIRSKNGNTTAIDFREMAPAKATRDMFLDDEGNPDSKKSLTSHLASGTPGTVAGFSLAFDKYGTMPLNKVVQPAFKLARDGFIVNDALATQIAKPT